MKTPHRRSVVTLRVSRNTKEKTKQKRNLWWKPAWNLQVKTLIGSNQSPKSMSRREEEVAAKKTLCQVAKIGENTATIVFLLIEAKRERIRGRFMLPIWRITSNLINWWKGLSLIVAVRDIPEVFLFSFLVFKNMQYTNFWFGKKWFSKVNSFDGVECTKSINFWVE